MSPPSPGSQRMSGGPRCLQAPWDGPLALVGPGIVGLSLLAVPRSGPPLSPGPVAPQCLAARRQVAAVAEGSSPCGVGAGLPSGVSSSGTVAPTQVNGGETDFLKCCLQLLLHLTRFYQIFKGQIFTK